MTSNPGQVEMMDDSARAASNSNFKVSKQQLVDVIECYRQRKYVEDIEYIKNDLKGIESLLEALDVNPQVGISATSLEARNQAFGNHLKELPTQTPFFTLLIGTLEDFMLQVLIVCAIFSITVDMSFATAHERGHAWIEGTAILIAVAVVSFVTAWSDYSKEKQFLIQQQIANKAKTVIAKRDSIDLPLHRDHLMCGDIVMVQNGMNIPVDGIIIEGVGIMADESAMTGESDHLQKETVEKCLFRQSEHELDGKFSKTPHDVPSPVLLSGTQIQTGQGWFLCAVVGDDTCENQILAAVEAKEAETTPLQDKLDTIATDIGKLGMYCAILIVHALMVRQFIESMLRRNFDLWGGETSGKEYGSDCFNNNPLVPDQPCDGYAMGYVKNWLGYIITGVAIIVVAVPEGLPLAVMISLAYSVSRMLKDNNFVKKLSSCEIMGGANNICSDKTGTLTKNQMTWTQIWSGEDYKIKDPDGTANFVVSDFIKNDFTKTLLAQAVSCNTLGTHEDAGATELAMLKFINRCEVQYQHLRQKYLPRDLMRFPFDSSRKRMSTILELEDHDKVEHGYPKRLHVKGASEIVLATCSHYIDTAGNKQPLDDQMSQLLATTISGYAKEALRTIAFAYKDLKENEGGPLHEEKELNSKIYKIEEDSLTLICIAGIKDIIREEVPGAVRMCNEAGVRVRMVTGDNKITAIAIAKECGILQEGEENEECVCMEGPEFNEYVGSLVSKETKERILVMGKNAQDETIGNIEAMKNVRQKLKVLARSRPNDKYIMVAGLRQLGDIVAVTGDGTNDAPALKKADVGFAMKTGTQVAHSAADIIIQDDNFASIVKACKWGRNVYDNIRRFLQFQLTVNVVALITSFIGSVIMWESPLQAIQLLWVNLIMDSLASLALATELPKDDLLQRPPYRKKEYIISQKMVKHILGMSIYQAIILFVFVFAGPQFIPELGAGVAWDDAKIGFSEELKLSHPNPKIAEDWTGEYVISGMVQGLDGADIYRHFETYTPSRHLTVVFNLFVLMQIWNMLGARKINDELNIFDGIFTNAMFMAVWLVIVFGQFFIVQYGGWALKVHKDGLNATQWIICLVLSLTCLIWNFVLKFVPDHICLTLGDEDQDDVQAAKDDYAKIQATAKLNEKL